MDYEALRLKYRWYIVGGIISYLYYRLMPFIYAFVLKITPTLIIVVIVSILFFTALGILFGKYATYDRTNRKSFENFAIGVYLGLVVGNLILLRQIDLIGGIYQAILVYSGCILGEKLKESL